MKSDNDKFIGLLMGLGLSKNEAETYIVLQRLESTSIRKIATETGINRGTTYEALKRLTEAGLVSVRQNGKREQYTAESPEKIFDIIRDKRHELLDASEMAKSIIPDILARRANIEGRPLVKYYEGESGLATILRDVLQTCRDQRHPGYYAYSSRLVRQYLAEHGERIVLHYLPAYSPQDNPIERVWWHLHEQITRNHRCAGIEELVKLTMAWLDEHGAFKIEGDMYQRLKAAA